jgi:hypothetical protein
MTVAHINQFRFLPALNFMQRPLIADWFIWRDDVQYQPKDWENRNKIKTRDGWMWLTVPMKKQPIGVPIGEAEIDNSVPRWRGKMLQSLICNYARSPYYDEFMPGFEEILSEDWRYLADLNLALFDWLRGAFRFPLKCRFVRASELGCTGDKDDILIEMCKKVGATTYLSGAEGRNYNRPERWTEANIALTYHDYTYPIYPQQHGEFEPWMCALDLLLNCGGQRGREILEQPMNFTS